MYTSIPYVTYEQIIDTVQAYLAIIGVYNFREILSVDPDYTAEKVLRNIIMYANREFSKHVPLLIVIKFYLNDEDRARFVDNFDDYVAGTLDPENIILVPDAVINVSSSPYFHPKWGPVHRFSYQPPWLILNGRRTGVVYVKAVCKYRLVEDQNNYLNSRIYYMQYETPIFDYFAKEVTYRVGLHISMLKKNYAISDLPVEVFGGLEEYIGELKTDLETYYQESMKNYLIMY